MDDSIIKIDNEDCLLCFIDIGNSRVKISITGLYESIAYTDKNWLEKVKSIIALFADKCLACVISDVNATQKNKIIPIIEQFSSIQIIETSELINKQRILDLSCVQNVGSDRILGMLGALSLSKPPLITIDCGTAITINAVNSEYQCPGGVIFAGATTQAIALVNNTFALPAIHLQQPRYITANNTIDAINNGILFATIGSIKEIVERIIHENFDDEPVHLFITGGSSDIILKFLLDWKPELKHVPELIIKGMKSLVMAYSDSKF